MNIRRLFIGVGAMLLVVGLLLPASLASASEVTVTLDAPTEITAGDEFVARLNISHVEDFDAAVVRVRFDPDILSLSTEDTDGNSIYDSVTDGNIGGTTIPVAATVEKEPGLIGIAANVPGFPGVTGEGYLMEFHFYALASGVIEIGLEHQSMSNKDAQDIPAAWVSNTGIAIVSSPSPSAADMKVTNLVVNPSRIEPGEKVSIEVDILNEGSAEGSYEVVLKINGTKEATREVTLADGESITVTFDSSKLAEGSYLANVNGLTKEFVVATAIPPKPPSSSESPVGVNWLVLGIIIGGAILAAVVVRILRLRWRA